MKTKFTVILFVLLSQLGLVAQPTVFGVDTLWKTGPLNKRINLVVMGDGFTTFDTANYNLQVNNLTNYLFSISPFDNYKNYFNIFRINSVSPESGVTHEGTATDVTEPASPVQFVITNFDTKFDNYGIHRLIYSMNSAKVYSVMANYFPNYDQLVILGNSTEYGGAGGAYAVCSIHPSSKEIFAHEIGHSFAGLADEYWAGPSYATEKPNMTANSNTVNTTWYQWIGDNNINVYPYGTTAPANAWFRPHQNCKMQFLNKPYCSVCKQTIIEKIHSLTNPIDDYSPSAVTTVSVTTANQLFKTKPLLPTPNTLKTTWQLNSNILANNVDSLLVTPSMLSVGNNTLTLTVIDTTQLTRDDYHIALHSYSVIWTVKANVAGIESITPNIKYTFFPNPTTDYLNVTYSLKEQSDVTIQVSDINGKIIYESKNKKQNIDQEYKSEISTSSYPAGNYLLTIRLNNQIINNKFIITK